MIHIEPCEKKTKRGGGNTPRSMALNPDLGNPGNATFLDRPYRAPKNWWGFPFPGRCPRDLPKPPLQGSGFLEFFSRACRVLGFEVFCFSPQRGSTSRSLGQRPRNPKSQKVRALKGRSNLSLSVRPGKVRSVP